VNLSTGISDDPERMMLGLFTAESALAAGKRVLIFLSLEAVRAVTPGALADVIPCEGCPSLEKLYKQVVRAGVEIYVCPMCLNAREIDAEALIAPAVPAGTARMMEWIGKPDASVFSF
jgi:predicted peroxiredoxin